LPREYAAALNKIKVIKRMAYSFRDDAHFFLSIARQKSALDRAEKKARV